MVSGRVGSVGLTRSREDAKTRSREGKRMEGGEVCFDLLLSPFNFLESTLYGMDAMAPSPPTPLPRFTGARGGIGDQSVVWFALKSCSCSCS